MKFKNESEMTEEMRDFLKSLLPSNTFQILESDKGFDIPICREGEIPKLFFLELKCFQRNHGRLGIGQGKGGGFQIEVLKKLPDYFEKYMKWILTYPEIYPGKYLLLQTSDIERNASGGEIGDKFNNVKLSIFKEYPLLDETELVSELKKWLLS